MTSERSSKAVTEICFDVKVQNVGESNLFLRALWATLRRRVGPFEWAFSPDKDGDLRTIAFGRASFRQLGVVAFGIRYSRRGVIDQLWARPEEGAAGILSDITASVDEAKDNMASPRSAWITTEIAVFPPVKIADYASDRLSLQSLADGVLRLGIHVSGYDTSDRESEFLAIVEPVLDALSVFTNCSFQYAPRANGDPPSEAANTKWAQADWLDNVPIVDGRLAITAGQLNCLDTLAIAPADGVTVRAARLFHRALHLDYAGDPALSEVVRTLYLSALEAASVPDQAPPNCDGCGQPVYSIRKRVREVARRYLGGAAEGIIDQAYKGRSGYLHTGSVLGKRPFGRGLRPLLDPDAPSGCYLPQGLSNTVNVREFTSFILREITREQWPEPAPL